VADGFGFIKDELAAIEARFGSVGRWGFLVTGVAVLFSTELALLDAVARVSADLLKVGFLRDSRLGLSQLYFAVVWAMVVFGAVVLLAGFDQPLALLVISAALNGFVMFLYSALLLWLSLATFHGPLRPHPIRIAALLGSVGFFGYFSVLTLIDRVTG
jgi:Mn2+/Fe2+ NRAMP family transporter